MKFEVVEEFYEKVRRIDLEVKNASKSGKGKLVTTFYEFKSVKEVPPAHFIEQFSKDLLNPNVTDLSQIKWVFDGKKVPADFKSKMMKEVKKIDVDIDVCKKLGTNDHAGLIRTISDNFDKLFIIEE